MLRDCFCKRCGAQMEHKEDPKDPFQQTSSSVCSEQCGYYTKTYVTDDIKRCKKAFNFETRRMEDNPSYDPELVGE